MGEQRHSAFRLSIEFVASIFGPGGIVTRLIRFVILLSIVVLASACSASALEYSLTQRPTARQAGASPTRGSSDTPQAESWRVLDLRFAHVLEVTHERLGSSQVRFDVTLVHDDDGEAPRYADWWQVEDLSGNILGKRILTHAHGTQPFTRSTTIEIPAGVEAVMIRGHDMMHGFGGRIIQLNLNTGEQEVLTNHPYVNP